MHGLLRDDRFCRAGGAATGGLCECMLAWLGGGGLGGVCGSVGGGGCPDGGAGWGGSERLGWQTGLFWSCWPCSPDPEPPRNRNPKPDTPSPTPTRNCNPKHNTTQHNTTQHNTTHQHHTPPPLGPNITTAPHQRHPHPQGLGVVVATGDNAEIGKINKMVSQVREEAARFLYWLFNLTGRRVGSLSLQA